MLVGLVDDLAVGVAEGADGRDVDDLGDLGLQRRPQHPLAAAHVGLVHRRVLLGRDADLVHRRGVDRPSQPSMPWRSAASSLRSPPTSSQPSSVSFAAFSGVRTRQTTSSPRARSWRTTSPPMKPVPPVTKTFTAVTLSRRKAAPRSHLQSTEVQRSRNGRKEQTRNGANGAGVSNPRARQRALAIGITSGHEDGDPLAELKELLRTAGVATAGEAVQQREQPDPDRYVGRGKLTELKAADRRLRRQPGRLRRRAGAAPGAQPRGGARRAGDRSHRGDPRHLRRPRPLGRGQAAGRAGPARVQPGPHAGALDPPRAARRGVDGASAPGARARARSRPTAASPATGSPPCAAAWRDSSATAA